GTIGQIYAEEAKHPHSVSSAIFEHWLPRFDQDHLPKSPLGIIFSLSDKVDNLLACFLANNIPTSSSDPFALRRQTLGIIRILIEHKLHLP
ncbi:glycine--tRNA ligase subunit beta, partial [bacterium LRH843]|nr:glycine--tRNA ligase subunit beta [bacterium LRH843]